MHAMNVVPKSIFDALTNINDVRPASARVGRNRYCAECLN